MKKSILKQIVGGILLGTFVFFTGPLLFIILLLKFIFTPFGMARYGGNFGRSNMAFGGRGFAFADKIRTMNDEEYAAFKTNFATRSRSCSYTKNSETEKNN